MDQIRNRRSGLTGASRPSPLAAASEKALDERGSMVGHVRRGIACTDVLRLSEESAPFPVRNGALSFCAGFVGAREHRIVRCSRCAEEATMQQEVRINTQKNVDARIAAGTSRLTACRIDFKAIKRAASFERVLQYYGIELRSGRG